MRTLQLHFPNDALATLDTVLKQTKDARVFRRVQAVREVVKGTRLQTASDTLAFSYSALRKWAHRFAHEGAPGLVDRPRSGRPPKVTGELEQHLNRLVEQDPLQHGFLYSQWSCRELATVLAAHGTARQRIGSLKHFSRLPIASLRPPRPPARPAARRHTGAHGLDRHRCGGGAYHAA